jgi:hypothetical protein
MGILTFYLYKKYRERVIENLSLAFGHEKDSKEIQRLAKEIFPKMQVMDATDPSKPIFVQRRNRRQADTVERVEYCADEVTGVNLHNVKTITIGFGDVLRDTPSKGKKAIEQMFSPEFRNRLTEIVGFARLDQAVMEKIVGKFLREIEVTLGKKTFKSTLLQLSCHEC